MLRDSNDKISRRKLLKMGGAGAFAVIGAALLNPSTLFGKSTLVADKHDIHKAMKGQLHEGMKHGYVPSNDATDGFKAAQKALTTFDYGKVSKLPDGRTLREYEITAYENEVQIAKGIKFPGWTFNGTIPGPTIRCTEGDVLRIHFGNATSHPHSIHFHGMHPTNMDGLEAVNAGDTFTYEFEAKPAGMHVYHCHVAPLARHIHKGLYGNFIIDPKKPRAAAREFSMVMNGFDLDLDGENEIYTVNGYAFAYQQEPIKVKVGELVRIYLSNLTEFDLINSFHLHANFFNYYATGADPEARPQFTDTIMQCQGERGILEIVFPSAGKYMFHAHQSEFAELGWMGFFIAE
ncbi:multicopper oxidase domain-containing protein [Paenibacillus sp. CGMCC 1.16610]|uniref:Copper-containing nitrite reductase n=1 Tax=Paenibacillus anseongense TaxID=2682845 RepID=A0ABW9ULJ2_9BACL|nr:MULTISPECIES: multicopper oxidase domain-containing protein [Paenibacillus]MBA2941313.1 multicopper oxidase domain-containing protein [Paenibacillus sp. CGMCC 1.16610]MVQ40132.1 multicopper oxidase domain-containing protein [Paenibacillus anseongense]